MAFFKRKEKDKENDKMTTLEQVRKAYEDLSDDDKKSFHQSIADRVHESIAAQERAEGDEDSQSAEAREHEALGAEHAAGRGDVSELHERDDTAEERREDARDAQKDASGDLLKSIYDRLDKLEQRFADKPGDEEALSRAEHIYGLRSGVFTADKANEEKITPKEAADLARKLKG